MATEEFHEAIRGIAAAARSEMSYIQELYSDPEFQELIPLVIGSRTALLMAADTIYPQFVELKECAQFCPPHALSDQSKWRKYVERQADRAMRIDRVAAWDAIAEAGEVDLQVLAGSSMREADNDDAYLRRLAELLLKTWGSALREQFPHHEYRVELDEEEEESEVAGLSGPTVRIRRVA